MQELPCTIRLQGSYLSQRQEGKELTLHFDRKTITISKENKELATISYQAINQESLWDKSFTKLSLAIGSVKIDLSVSFVIFCLSTVNYLISS